MDIRVEGYDMSSEQVMTVINVADDFSDFPVGRDKNKNPFSGDRFRDDYLIPPLKRNEKVLVNFENVFACPPSFLDEAFGGLVRKYKNNKKQLDHMLSLIDFRKTNITKYDGFNELAKMYIKRELDS